MKKKKYYVFMLLALFVFMCSFFIFQSMRNDLCTFIEISDIDGVQAKLESVNINSVDKNGMSPLHLVARLPLLEKLFLNRKIQSHYKYDAQANLEIAQLLIEKGADLNRMDFVGFTPLMRSIEADNLDVTELLIQSGTDVNVISPTYGSALHLSVDFSNFRAIKLLISNNANVNLQDTEGSTPLHNAIITNDLNAILYLVDKGADANIKDKQGITPLDLASTYNQKDAIKILSK